MDFIENENENLQCTTERVVMEDGGVGDVCQLGEVPHNVVESIARRPHLHQVACLLGGQVRPLPAHGGDRSSVVL